MKKQPTFAQQVRKALSASQIYPASVGNAKDGSVLVRFSFFYKNGKTSEHHANRVEKALLANGLTQHQFACEHGEHYAAFRGGASVASQSHFWVRVFPQGAR